MFPEITVFGKAIGTYAILSVLGFLAVLWVGIRTAKRRRLDDNLVIMLLLAK